MPSRRDARFTGSPITVYSMRFSEPMLPENFPLDRIDELEASIGELMAQAGVEDDEDGKKDGEAGDKNESES